VLVIPSRLIATAFALVCFTAAVIVGLAVGNTAVTVLWRALLIMLGAWLIGQIIGGIFQHTLDQHVAEYRKQHPLPGEGTSDNEPAEQDQQSQAPASEDAAEPVASST
jgi:hypothetical protein